MHLKIIPVTILFVIFFLVLAWGDGVRVPREETARMMAEATLEHGEAGMLQFGFSALWLDERVEGNERLREWFRTGHRSEKPLELLLEKPEEYAEDLSRSLGGVKWLARTWLRIYYLFSEGSAYFPGRLDPDVQEKLEALCWAYGRHNSTVARADPKYIWAIQGSENHDMMDLSNAFLALQAIQENPDYRDRTMRDGHTPADHVASWSAYYRLYAKERAAHGLFVELSSPIYGKHFLGELYNIHDFARDPVLRKKMGMLLDVTWADWAIDQLGGVRGGGKTRTYFGHYAERGTSDSWYTMSNFLFDRPTDGHLSWAARHGQVEFVIATSGYKVPEVVAEIAMDPEGKGEFEYISRRPARMLRPEEVSDRPPLRDGTWYHMDPADPRLVRYSYCTPDYVMGSLWIDPALGTIFRLDPELEFPREENYAAISSQSQWQGIIFATDPNARVFAQCVGEQANARVNFQQHVAVQNKDVLIVRKHRKAESAGAMRVFFADGMKERLIERNGWLFLREGNAFLGVGVMPFPDGPVGPGYRWEGSRWIYLEDEYAPVVFVAGRSSRYEDIEAFIQSVETHEYSLSASEFNYVYEDPESGVIRLTLPIGDTERLPEIDGTPVNLSPSRVYDSPFLSAELGSPVITIQKGEHTLVHDFSAIVTD